MKDERFMPRNPQPPVEFEMGDYDEAVKQSPHQQTASQRPATTITSEPQPETPKMEFRKSNKSHRTKQLVHRAQRDKGNSETWNQNSTDRHGNAQRPTDRASELEQLE